MENREDEKDKRKEEEDRENELCQSQSSPPIIHSCLLFYFILFIKFFIF